ncbi:MAG: NAD(P)H-binding protein [Gammaproteobacteria bacterium]|nr:NAD(P)H-binding protein [Gammaproteobacteria bacterium]
MNPLIVTIVSFFILGAPSLDASPEGDNASTHRLLIFGASGRLGGYIVEEALLRGHHVTAVSRDATRLESFKGRVNVESADILDHIRLAYLIGQHDAVIVSVGGTPRDSDPSNYIVPRAAQSLVEVMESMEAKGTRLLFVGNLYTLKYEDDKTLLELGRVDESHQNFAMFYGHQLALDIFRQSSNVDWTVASPPNGLRLKGRTGMVRWGGEQLLRDDDGAPSTISPEDFAYAVLEELQQGNYIRKLFNVAR